MKMSISKIVKYITKSSKENYYKTRWRSEIRTPLTESSKILVTDSVIWYLKPPASKCVSLVFMVCSNEELITHKSQIKQSQKQDIDKIIQDRNSFSHEKCNPKTIRIKSKKCRCMIWFDDIVPILSLLTLLQLSWMLLTSR